MVPVSYIHLGDFHEVNVIVKGDVDGSVEALSDSLINLSTEQVHLNVIPVSYTHLHEQRSAFPCQL